MSPVSAIPLRGRHQRGAAALTITLLLFFAMGLMAAYAARGLLWEQRASAHQYHAAQAFEAAEAGIDWTLAHLNQANRIDAQCLSSTQASDTPFRERFVHTHPDTARMEPVTWTSGATPMPLQPACVHSATGWSCHCPSNGLPVLDSTDAADELPHPAFVVQFSTEALPGQIRITSIGCSSAEGPCRPGTAGQPEAVARLQIVLSLLPGLRVPPQATLTTRGAVDAGAAALGIHNLDAAAGGITVRAGGHLQGPSLRLSTAPGGAASASLQLRDPALAAMNSTQLFTHHFGVPLEGWRTHAAVQPIDCLNDCTARLAAAIEGAGDNRMLLIQGDARLSGPATLGSATQPVVLIVTGRLTLAGDIALYGLVYATDIRWDDTHSPQAQLHGALISATGYQGTGAPDLHYDTAVLRTLQRHTGSYLRVPGSWRDF